MDKAQIERLQQRTDAKLRYAHIHLDEMKSHGMERIARGQLITRV